MAAMGQEQSIVIHDIEPRIDRVMSFESSLDESTPRKRQCRRSDSRVEMSSVIAGDEQAVPTASSFSDKLGSEVISIYAGPEEKLYTVHKKLLSDAADVFDKMFNGNFKEASDNVAHFPEDDVDAWGLLIEWLYQGRLQPLILTAHRDKSDAATIEKRIKLFCLAETYNIVDLMDSTVDTLAQAFKVRIRTPELATFRYVYAHTQEHSPLRQLISRWFYHVLVTRDEKRPTRYSTDSVAGLAAEHPDLIQDLFEMMRGQQASVPREIMDPAEVPLCAYHQHTIRGNPICSRKRPMSAGAEKLLKLMMDTFPNSRKRWTVEALARRLSLDRISTLNLIDELVDLKKAAWVLSGLGTVVECL